MQWGNQFTYIHKHIVQIATEIPKKIAPVWPFPLNPLSSLCPSCFQKEVSDRFRCEIVLADEIFNTISRRPEPNFFHMVLSLKTEGMRGRVYMARGKTRNGCIENMVHVRNSVAGLFCSKAEHEGDINKLSSHIWPLDLFSKRERVLQRTAHLASRLTFSSDNLACRQLSKSHRPVPKMIYTHTLRSQHKPLYTAKLQNRCQGVWQHNGGPFQKTSLSVDMDYLSCLVFKCCYFLWLFWCHIFGIDDPRASDWLVFFSPFLSLCVHISHAATHCLSVLSFITPPKKRKENLLCNLLASSLQNYFSLF